MPLTNFAAAVVKANAIPSAVVEVVDVMPPDPPPPWWKNPMNLGLAGLGALLLLTLLLPRKD